jgi:hypothetical protein
MQCESLDIAGCDHLRSWRGSDKATTRRSMTPRIYQRGPLWPRDRAVSFWRALRHCYARGHEPRRITLRFPAVPCSATWPGPHHEASARPRSACGTPPISQGSWSNQRRSSVLGAISARKKGAGIEELASAVGWLPHTTRAALTGLRRRGYAIERERSEKGGSVYRIDTGTASVLAA